MASKFLTNIDLNQNELINAKFQVVGTLPSVGNTFEGHLVYNSATNTIHVYANGAWRSLPHTIVSGGGAGIAEALEVSESNGTITLTLKVADVDSAGLLSSTFWSLLNGATSDATVSTLVKRDSGGNISVATPTADGHAATKGYVDAARSGLDVKQSVRAATTGAINLSSDLENGDAIDGVTLATGDRVLVKHQGTASENGIYVVQASGAAVRATDFDGTGEVSGGAFTFVEEGTVNADSGWVVSSNGAITVGTDSIEWVQFSGAGQITAGDGLTKSGNTINVVGTADRITANADSVDIASTYVGQSSITTLGTITTGVWNGTDVAVADGGTGSGTASGARTNLAETPTSGQTTSTAVLARVVHQACAASSVGVSTTTVTHNFGTKNLTVQVYQVSTGETVNCDVVRSSNDAVVVTMNGTISSGDFNIVVTG
jgi:hypothetical protein